MKLIVGTHLALAFALELIMLLAFALFGFRLGGGGWSGGAAAALLVGVVVAVWARFAAPKAAGRLSGAPLLALKAALFVGAALALWASGWSYAAIAFAVVAAGDLGLALRLGRL